MGIKARAYKSGTSVVVQAVLDKEEVDRYLGPIGAPSATDRVTVTNRVEQALFTARRVMLPALMATIDTERANQAVLEAAAQTGEPISDDDRVGDRVILSPDGPLETEGHRTTPDGTVVERGPVKVCTHGILKGQHCDWCPKVDRESDAPFDPDRPDRG